MGACWNPAELSMGEIQGMKKAELVKALLDYFVEKGGERYEPASVQRAFLQKQRVSHLRRMLGERLHAQRGGLALLALRYRENPAELSLHEIEGMKKAELVKSILSFTQAPVVMGKGAKAYLQKQRVSKLQRMLALHLHPHAERYRRERYAAWGNPRDPFSVSKEREPEDDWEDYLAYLAKKIQDSAHGASWPHAEKLVEALRQTGRHKLASPLEEGLITPLDTLSQLNNDPIFQQANARLWDKLFRSWPNPRHARGNPEWQRTPSHSEIDRMTKKELIGALRRHAPALSVLYLVKQRVGGLRDLLKKATRKAARNPSDEVLLLTYLSAVPLDSKNLASKNLAFPDWKSATKFAAQYLKEHPDVLVGSESRGVFFDRVFSPRWRTMARQGKWHTISDYSPRTSPEGWAKKNPREAYKMSPRLTKILKRKRQEYIDRFGYDPAPIAEHARRIRQPGESWESAWRRASLAEWRKVVAEENPKAPYFGHLSVRSGGWLEPVRLGPPGVGKSDVRAARVMMHRARELDIDIDLEDLPPHLREILKEEVEAGKKAKKNARPGWKWGAGDPESYALGGRLPAAPMEAVKRFDRARGIGESIKDLELQLSRVQGKKLKHERYRSELRSKIDAAAREMESLQREVRDEILEKYDYEESHEAENQATNALRAVFFQARRNPKRMDWRKAAEDRRRAQQLPTRYYSAAKKKEWRAPTEEDLPGIMERIQALKERIDSGYPEAVEAARKLHKQHPENAAFYAAHYDNIKLKALIRMAASIRARRNPVNYHIEDRWMANPSRRPPLNLLSGGGRKKRTSCTELERRRLEHELNVCTSFLPQEPPPGSFRMAANPREVGEFLHRMRTKRIVKDLRAARSWFLPFSLGGVDDPEMGKSVLRKINSEIHEAGATLSPAMYRELEEADLESSSYYRRLKPKQDAYLKAHYPQFSGLLLGY